MNAKSHSRKLFRIGMFAMAVVMCWASRAPALENVKVNGVTWRWTYEGDVLPTSATPAWTFTFIGGSQSTDGAVLSIYSTGSVSQTAYDIITGGVGNTNWDGTKRSTVEFSMRTVSTVSNWPSAQVQIANGARYFGFEFGTNMVKTSTGTFFTNYLDGTAFHLYRITMDTGTTANAYLYVDNGQSPVMTNYGSTASLNRIYFGDASASGIGGHSQWNFLRWTNEGMFPPTLPPAGLFMTIK